MSEPIQKIVIPKFKTHVVTSDGQAPKYYGKYEYNGVSRDYKYSEKDLGGKYKPIKEEYEGPPYNLPAPKSKLLKVVSDDYDWKWYKGYMVDENEERVLANPRSAGKEKKTKISGNNIIGGSQERYLVQPLKKSFVPHIRKQMRAFRDEELPVAVKWYYFEPPAEKDLINLFFYYKYFEDMLVELDILPQDTMRYVSSVAGPIYSPVESREQRKLIFEFYTDNRQSIQQHPFWQ